TLLTGGADYGLGFALVSIRAARDRFGEGINQGAKAFTDMVSRDRLAHFSLLRLSGSFREPVEHWTGTSELYGSRPSAPAPPPQSQLEGCQIGLRNRPRRLHRGQS